MWITITFELTSLPELAEHEKNVTRDIHRYNAYRKAAVVLADYPTRIKSGDEAKKLKGVGDKIAKKIDEYLATGKLKKLENVNYLPNSMKHFDINKFQIQSDSKNVAINLLTRVSGIGPAKAANLVSKGITSLEDLKKNLNELTHHQIIGLKYDYQIFVKSYLILHRQHIFSKVINNNRNTNLNYTRHINTGYCTHFH